MDVRNVSKILEKVVVKNSPAILTGLSVAGLITTAVTAVKATPKALRILEREELRREDEGLESHLTAKETILLTWKCYAPAAAIGAVTIICIIGANSINARRNAALASLYSLSETALKEYQAKVVETIGKNKEKDIRDSVAADRIKNNPVREDQIIVTGHGDTLCYESLSGRYFRSDIESIRKAFNTIGRTLVSDMQVTLNDFYYELGLKTITTGDLLIFHIDDGIPEPQFSSHLTANGTPCLVVDFDVDPRYAHKDHYYKDHY